MGLPEDINEKLMVVGGMVGLTWLVVTVGINIIVTATILIIQKIVKTSSDKKVKREEAKA